MNYRHTTLLAALSLTAAGVRTIDLNVDEPISRIDIRFQITKTKNAMDAHPAADIQKIEIVDGSDILHSLTGYENQALCIYDRKVPTMVHGQHSPSNAECSLYGIDFGRFLWDTELALITSRFRNPQLKITYTLNLSDTGGVAGEMEVTAHLFDEKLVSPIGFLMSKEIYSYTPGQESSYEHVQLPLDYPLRKMLIRAFHSGHEPWDSIKEVRLDEDNLRRIPLDIGVENYHRVNKGVDPCVEELIQGITGTGGNDFFITPSDYWGTVTLMAEAGNVNMYLNGSQMGGKFKCYASGTSQFRGIARGYLPNHCVQFKFGDHQEIGDWYDVSKLHALQLRLRAGTSGNSGSVQIVTQQLRRY